MTDPNKGTVQSQSHDENQVSQGRKKKRATALLKNLGTFTRSVLSTLSVL